MLTLYFEQPTSTSLSWSYVHTRASIVQFLFKRGVLVFFLNPALNLSPEIFILFCTFFYNTLLMCFLYKSSVAFSCDVYSQSIFQMILSNCISNEHYICNRIHITHSCSLIRSLAGLLTHTAHCCIWPITRDLVPVLHSSIIRGSLSIFTLEKAILHFLVLKETMKYTLCINSFSYIGNGWGCIQLLHLMFYIQKYV
jgi:hypothetical protein